MHRVAQSVRRILGIANRTCPCPTLADEVVIARGAIGDADPLLAIEDALAGFPADESEPAGAAA